MGLVRTEQFEADKTRALLSRRGKAVCKETIVGGEYRISLCEVGR